MKMGYLYMNKVILIGRLTKDPDVRCNHNGNEQQVFARYTLAVDRRIKKDSYQSADFISCVAFGHNAEFAEKWLRKGMKIAITGHIQTGNYTNKDGVRVYTTDVVVEEQEFAESKSSGGNQNNYDVGYDAGRRAGKQDDFMDIDDADLPFN